MCTKVAHLKEGEVRLRRDSSLCNRAISISSARGHGCILSLSISIELLKLLAKLAELECR